jgi:hypothetical protein
VHNAVGVRRFVARLEGGCMSWLYLELKHEFMDNKAWQKKKGLIAKGTVGKTGIGEAMDAVKVAWAKVDAEKFGMYHVTTDGAKSKKEVEAEISKLKKIFPLVKEVEKRCEATLKDYSKQLPSGAKTYLAKVIAECKKFPDLVQNAERDEIEHYKKFDK